MAFAIEELDYQKTALGELVLRRRRSPSVADEWVYEVKLGEEMLMSSTVNDSERALATLALADRAEEPCDVLVGGLGLGYTAAEALKYRSVQRLVVVELLQPVIAWHRNRLVPMADKLLDDPRCSIVEADFFKYVGADCPTDREPYDVILLDIDHAPDYFLHDRHADFYSDTGLQSLADCLRPNGVFALWSALQPEPQFLELLAKTFATCKSHEVSFLNPHVHETDTNWVIIANKAGT